MRAFLGVAGWLTEFISNFYEKAAALPVLNSNIIKFKWTPEAQASFELLKEEASKPLSVARPTYRGRFIVLTDISILGMAAVLFQENIDGERRIL